MKTYFTLNTENMKIMPTYLITSGIDFEETEMDRPEGFSEYLLLLTMEGRGRIRYGGKEHLLEQGSLLFLPPWIPHYYIKETETWRTNWISFDGNGLEDWLKSLIKHEIHILPAGKEDPIGDQLIEIYRLTDLDYQKNALRISSVIYRMVTDVVSRIQRMDQRNSCSGNYVDRIMVYLNDHYREDITIDQLAEVVGISPQYMCRLFARQLGLRPFEYLRQLRINKSKNMLMSPDSPKIETVAKAVGFNNPSYFGAVFKRYENMTPRDFMKLHQRSRQAG